MCRFRLLSSANSTKKVAAGTSNYAFAASTATGAAPATRVATAMPLGDVVFVDG